MSNVNFIFLSIILLKYVFGSPEVKIVPWNFQIWLIKFEIYKKSGFKSHIWLSFNKYQVLHKFVYLENVNALI